MAVLIFFILSLSILILRLFYLQVIRFGFYSKLANEQHIVSVEISPRRGTIFDRNMRVLALNLNSDSVFANARIVKDKRGTSRALAMILKTDEGELYERLSRDKGFIWLKRKISPAAAEEIKRLNIEGIDIIKESERFYPNRDLACHKIGTVDIDNTGLEGLELKYNNYLKGESGWLISTQDAKRKLL